MFERNDFPLFFSQLQKELYIPAIDLDTCKREVFGKTGLKHIPFAKAIAASSAIPIFFQPVNIEDRYYIDGGTGELAHLDLAAAAGARLVIMINPMVPIH